MPRASKIAAAKAADKAPEAPAPAPLAPKRASRRASNVKPAPVPAELAPEETEPLPEENSGETVPAEIECTGGFAPAFAELASSVPPSVHVQVVARLAKKGIDPANADLCPIDAKIVLETLEHAVEVYKRKRSRAREAAALKRSAAPDRDIVSPEEA